MSPFFDAHNHLQDPRLTSSLEAVIETMREVGIERCVVNGTSEDDWPRVAELARTYPDLIQPSFGLHPWRASRRSPDWLATLTAHLDAFPNACIGECGLDRWIKDHDLPDQRDVFLAQLDLAATRNLPLSLHCLKAWGPLLESLESNPRPQRGFLLHSYGGSREMVPQFAALGAYFSFSGYFLAPRKEPVREAFRAVPPERLLIETDAPDMLLPADLRSHLLRNDDGEDLNHPANLPQIANNLAAVLATPAPTLARQLRENFFRFFLSDS